MVNIITKDTSRKEWLKDYKSYPDVTPEGLEDRHDSRILPIFYEIKKGSTVLDLGCNSGDFMKELRDKKKCKVIGVDASDTALSKATAKGFMYKRTLPHNLIWNSVFRLEDEYLPFPDNSFDYVTLMEVIVHVLDPKKCLSEIRRVLKPDGILLGSTPHENLERYIWDDKRMHRRYYNETEIRNELFNEFDKVFTTVLTGAQFSIGFMNSYLADKAAQILFKAGGNHTKTWGEALLNKDKLRVWFMGTQTSADFYYRMGGFCDKMQAQGAETLFDPYDVSDPESPGKWQNKIKIGPAGDLKAGHAFLNDLESVMKVADFSVWQAVRNLSALLAMLALKEKLNTKIVTEVDDYMFDVPRYNPAAGSYKAGSDDEYTVLEQLKASDALIVSTEYLRKQMNEMFPDKIIHVIPNSIDFDLWDSQKPDMTYVKDDSVRIAYTGAGTHNMDMSLIKEPLMAIIEDHPRVQLMIAHPLESWNDVRHPRVHFSQKWSDILNYPSFLKGWNMDIGIAPLRDNNFNRAKSNLRWLEYSALGVPTVASNVEPFKCINQGKDGFICSTKQEWYDTLEMLIIKKGKRKEIGLNANKRVRKDFNMNKVAKKYMSILKGLRNEFR